jgi:PIN domain nuclease of toxin-antitoxin system
MTISLVRLLLDTQVLIFLIKNQLDRLDPRTASALTAPDVDLFVSVASLWEIAIKTRLGKLEAGTPLDRLPELIENMGLAVIAILAPHVLARVEPPTATRDPFDRLLLAQCALEGMRLVTVDRALVDHPAAYAPT